MAEGKRPVGDSDPPAAPSSKYLAVGMAGTNIHVHPPSGETARRRRRAASTASPSRQNFSAIVDPDGSSTGHILPSSSPWSQPRDGLPPARALPLTLPVCGLTPRRNTVSSGSETIDSAVVVLKLFALLRLDPDVAGHFGSGRSKCSLAATYPSLDRLHCYVVVMELGLPWDPSPDDVKRKLRRYPGVRELFLQLSRLSSLSAYGAAQLRAVRVLTV